MWGADLALQEALERHIIEAENSSSALVCMINSFLDGWNVLQLFTIVYAIHYKNPEKAHNAVWMMKVFMVLYAMLIIAQLGEPIIPLNITFAPVIVNQRSI